MSKKFLYVDVSGVYAETPGAYEESDFSAVSTANAPVKLDASGLLGAAQISENRIDHDALLNYVSAEHVDWASPGAGTINPSNYVDNDTTYTSSDFDHDQLTNFDQAEHFTVGSIDHSSLGSFGTDNHTEYILADGTRAFTATVIGVTPVAANNLATKGYVDNVAEGLKPKTAVRVATTASVLLASELENGDTLDGITLATGDRVLVKDQDSAPEDNGIYIVQASGAAIRSTDFDSLTPIDEINGAYVPVQEGTANAGKYYVQTGAVSTLGTDAINFVYFNSAVNYTAGTGIDSTQLSSNIIQVDLLSDGGIKVVGQELGIEASDIAGEGLVDDESDNLAIDWYSSLSDKKAVSASSLSSNDNGYGAAIIGVEDAGGYFDASNVEGVLQELATYQGGVIYNAGTGGVSVGDAVYVSAADTATVYSDITQNEAVIGLATEAVSAGQSFRVAANDTLLESVITGGTAGRKYFWNGSGWQNTLPNSSGEYVWLGGVAKNGEDIHVEVMFIKRNA